MKLVNTTLIFAAALTSTVAHAGRKEPLRVDFNQMIEQGAQDRRQLELGESTATAETAARANPADRRVVVDFIDMEIGVAEDVNVGRR